MTSQWKSIYRYDMDDHVKRQRRDRGDRAQPSQGGIRSPSGSADVSMQMLQPCLQDEANNQAQLETVPHGKPYPFFHILRGRFASPISIACPARSNSTSTPEDRSPQWHAYHEPGFPG
jgi:hypothetical protein